MTEEEAYHELCAYTLGLGDPRFIHQHVVDTFAAQQADEQTKPIALTFALAGLFLHIEAGCTGKEVQRAHMKMARQKRPWPSFSLPQKRGTLTASDVLAHPPGHERNEAIEAWCASVWEAFEMIVTRSPSSPSCSANTRFRPGTFGGAECQLTAGGCRDRAFY